MLRWRTVDHWRSKANGGPGSAVCFQPARNAASRLLHSLHRFIRPFWMCLYARPILREAVTTIVSRIASGVREAVTTMVSSFCTATASCAITALLLNKPLASTNRPAAISVEMAILSLLLLLNVVFMFGSLGSVVGVALLMTELYGDAHDASNGLRPNAKNGV